jgi:hypothetical protein
MRISLSVCHLMIGITFLFMRLWGVPDNGPCNVLKVLFNESARKYEREKFNMSHTMIAIGTRISV